MYKLCLDELGINGRYNYDMNNFFNMSKIIFRCCDVESTLYSNQELSGTETPGWVFYNISLTYSHAAVDLDLKGASWMTGNILCRDIYMF